MESAREHDICMVTNYCTRCGIDAVRAATDVEGCISDETAKKVVAISHIRCAANFSRVLNGVLDKFYGVPCDVEG